MEHLEPSVGSSHCEWKGRASYFDVTTEERMERRAAWFYPDPTPPFAGLEDHVAFYPSRMDGCWVGGQKVEAQEGDFTGVGSPDIVGPFKAPPAPGAGRYTVDASSLRKEYTRAGLDRADLDPDPIVQFQEWFEKVIDADLHEPNAMIVSTASTDGEALCPHRPSQGYDERGFVFYTNYEGRKANEIEANPMCALLFYWGELERQVRIEGRAGRLSGDESDAYFEGRPEGAVSGRGLPSRAAPSGQEERSGRTVKALEAQYEGREIPRPPFWGGYRVEPDTIEFWQGRENRLHDTASIAAKMERGGSSASSRSEITLLDSGVSARLATSFHPDRGSEQNKAALAAGKRGGP